MPSGAVPAGSAAVVLGGTGAGRPQATSANRERVRMCRASGRLSIAGASWERPTCLGSLCGRLLARPQDASDLASKINELLADPDRARAMGRAGREKVLAMFSWGAVSDRLEEVYRCLVPSST